MQGYRDDDPVGKRGLTCSKVACDDGWTSDGALLCFQCRQGYSNLVGGVCYQPCPGATGSAAGCCKARVAVSRNVAVRLASG